MSNYERIRNDEEIIRLYHEVTRFEEVEQGLAHHDLNHVCNVAELVKVLLEKMDYAPSFIECGQIAALLHDVGAVTGKKGHAERSYEFAKNYFKRKKIELSYEAEVLDAILVHSNGFSSSNVMANVLILCDKLDIKQTRLGSGAYCVRGLRQMQYIKDIEIEIKQSDFCVNFKTEACINLEELQEYYFIQKVREAIHTFCSKFAFHANVLVNGREWEYFNMERKIIIKPHHFMDIIKLYGAGIEKFVPDEKMGHDFYKVANAIIENKNIPLKLTTLGDDICKPCSKYKEICMDEVRNIPCFTSKNEYNSTLDKRIMSLYHLEKEWYTAYELCTIFYASRQLIYEVWSEEDVDVTMKRFSLFEKGANKYLIKSDISE